MIFIKISVKQILLVTISIALIGVSINMFLGPHNVAAGGVSGIGILVEKAFQIDRALTVLVLNLILLVLAFIFLGKETFYRTVLGSILLPISLAVVPEIMITDDRLLSVIFGSAIFAFGVAILYRIEASSGGTTIPPLIFKKYFGLGTSIGLLISDATIVIFNIFVFGTEEFLLAILSIVTTSIIMNYIETGLKKRKSVMIMSENHIEEIREELLKHGNLGVTILPASSGYTNKDKNILMVVLGNREYISAINMIDEIDKNCLILTYSVSDIHGLGFSYHSIN